MTCIFLYGPSGSGKSTIGKNLARNLKLPFIDLDDVIESHAGMTIPQIMEKQGESAFRDLETTALQETVGHAESETDSQEKIIALGGGALLRQENRALSESLGKIILLMANVETLFQRLNESHTKRPLLAGDLREKLASLLEKRSQHYASFAHQLHVDGKSVEQIVHQLQIQLGRYHLEKMGEYDVRVRQITTLPYGNIIVTDENIAPYHLHKIKQAVGRDIPSVILPAGEEYKNLETVSLLWKAFLDNGLDRRSTVIALGGGVIGDMTGFAASTFMRGIQWIGIPTTLLSMVDASLGGKTGFDLPEGKNLIGSFHPPKLVLADPSLLLTLKDRELRSGMAEVVKHGIISDPELFKLCSRGMDWVKDNLEEIVKRAMAVKITVIEEDPYEKGIRATLNLGHTVGHAVELVSKFNLRHGEAIAIGTVVEAQYAERTGLAKSGLAEKIKETFTLLGLPTQIPADMRREDIVRTMRVDKKKSAKAIRFALPVEIGRVDLVDVSDLKSVINE